MKNSIFVILFLGAISPLFCQESPFLYNVQNKVNKAIENYQNGSYSLAYNVLNEVLSEDQFASDPRWKEIRVLAKQYMLQSAIALERPDAELAVITYIKEISPDVSAQALIVNLAEYFYNKKEFEKALTYYAKVSPNRLNNSNAEYLNFQIGYSYFALEKWKESITAFKKVVSNKESKYFGPGNYYLGMGYFKEKNYKDALSSFKAIEDVKNYQYLIPYQIAQIYFIQKNYDEVIRFGVPKYEDSQIKNKKELGQLIGQSLFEKNEFSKALPYLQAYAEGNTKLKDEELYQLGFCLYDAKKYGEAAENLLPLSDAENILGQNALFYLADCYLKTNNSQDALLALDAAARLNFDPIIQQEALFNHGKLAYELKNDREALNDLKLIPKESPHFSEAQSIISKVLLSFRDYQEAGKLLVEMQKKNGGKELNEANQTINLNLGIQYHQKKDFKQAQSYLLKSLETPVKPNLEAISLYWLADVSNREKKYAESISYLNRYFSKADTKLPEETSIVSANYLQGYNFLRSEKMDNASSYFQKVVDAFDNNKKNYARPEINQRILGDATLQLANVFLVSRNYEKASRYYNEIIQKNYPAIDYAMYQKAIIEGFKGNTLGEITLLESLVNKYPKSGLADDALLLIGQISQEINQTQQAIKAYERLVSQYNNTSEKICEAFNGLGTSYYNLDNFTESIKNFKKVFSFNCDSSDKDLALSGLEEVYLNKLNKPDEFIAFKASIPGYEVNANERETIAIRSADIRFENQDYRGAVEGYTNYLKQFPSGTNRAKAFFFRAESYIKIQNYTNAAQDYEATVALYPNSFSERALEKASLTYLNLKNYTKALANFRLMETRASEEDKKIEAQVQIIVCAYQLKDRSILMEYADKIQRNPVISQYEKTEANYYLGKLLLELKEFNQAISALEQVSKQPDAAQKDEANYLISQYYLSLKDIARAEQFSMAGFQEYINAYWAAKCGLVYVDTQIEIKKYIKAKIVLDQLEADFAQEDGISNEINARKETLRKIEANTNK
ncbi:MAG: tetratricopeptide repeat protein [Saprospiraceae bacterium]